MKKAFSVILALVLCLGMMQLMPVTAKASGNDDTTPPHLTGVDISGTSFTVGEQMTVTVHTDEEGSGVSGGAWSWVSFASKARAFCGFAVYLEAQDEKTLVGNFTFDADTAPTGTYALDEIYYRDNACNTIHYRKESSFDPEIPPEMYHEITFNNTARTDWEGPVLYSLSADKAEYNAGDTITLEGLAHDPSGIDSCIVNIANAAVCLYPDQPGNPDHIKGSAKIPSKARGGVYSTSSVFIFDSVSPQHHNNGRIYVDNEAPNEPIPDAARINVTVHSNYVPPSEAPLITSFKIEPTTVKQGEPIKVTVEMDPKGHDIETFGVGFMPKSRIDYGTGGPGLSLQKKAEGLYEGTTILPVDWPTGEWFIFSVGMVDYEQNYSYVPTWADSFYINGARTLPDITINPVFNGTENTTVEIGSGNFDPKKDVSASNTTEGDMSGKIEVLGSVDTNKAGVYFIKYKIKSSQTDEYSNSNYYYDFRWVGVTETEPEETATPDQPLAVTNDSLTIGADKTEVSITKDDKSIDFANTMSEQGEYTIKADGNAAGTFGTKALSGIASSTGKETVKAVVDKTGPKVTATWTTPVNGSLSVNIATKDIAGTAELKWKPGICSSDDCKANGTVFNGTFTAGGYGYYTIYAKDKLGNESLKVMNITSSALSDVLYSAGTMEKDLDDINRNCIIKLDEYTSDVTITPVKSNPGNTMTIDGKKAVSKTIKGLMPGKSKNVNIVVYGTNKRIKTTYTVTITRDMCSNNTLQYLTTGRVTLQPSFSNTVTDYKIVLPAKTSSVTINAKAAGYGAKIYFGTKKATSKRISLKNGASNTIIITAEAQNGDIRTFNITIERLPKT